MVQNFHFCIFVRNIRYACIIGRNSLIFKHPRGVSSMQRKSFSLLVHCNDHGSAKCLFFYLFDNI